MARIVITSPVVINGKMLRKGQVVEMSDAEITAIGSAARVTAYRDVTGETTAVSN
jgi:hypothetical protein